MITPRTCDKLLILEKLNWLNRPYAQAILASDVGEFMLLPWTAKYRLTGQAIVSSPGHRFQVSHGFVYAMYF